MNPQTTFTDAPRFGNYVSVELFVDPDRRISVSTSGMETNFASILTNLSEWVRMYRTIPNSCINLWISVVPPDRETMSGAEIMAARKAQRKFMCDNHGVNLHFIEQLHLEQNNAEPTYEMLAEKRRANLAAPPGGMSYMDLSKMKVFLRRKEIVTTVISNVNYPVFDMTSRVNAPILAEKGYVTCYDGNKTRDLIKTVVFCGDRKWGNMNKKLVKIALEKTRTGTDLRFDSLFAGMHALARQTGDVRLAQSVDIHKVHVLNEHIYAKMAIRDLFRFTDDFGRRPIEKIYVTEVNGIDTAAMNIGSAFIICKMNPVFVNDSTLYNVYFKILREEDPSNPDAPARLRIDLKAIPDDIQIASLLTDEYWSAIGKDAVKITNNLCEFKPSDEVSILLAKDRM